MSGRRGVSRTAQAGMVLISAMLLLLIITILAVSMFRSFGVQEMVAGNVREKQRALHAAEAAQQYAEWWLSNNSG
ncbi:MAG TPA: PilX N-terminal domain-containing pilus assembly protein, partial [Steroidobacteraceae bacterium]|nr:PilX N-terminal domain-containing pilus assembly protein [Steroidobacteraceae bacterium]